MPLKGEIMNAVNKVSDITAQDIAEYLRLNEPDASEINFINSTLKSAKDYILKYTGISDATELDKYQDMIIAVYVLGQDMYDTRSMYVTTGNVNRVVENILGLHQRNLL